MTEIQEKLDRVFKPIENTLVSSAEKDFNESIKTINGVNGNPKQKYDPRDLNVHIESYKVSVVTIFYYCFGVLTVL